MTLRLRLTLLYNLLLGGAILLFGFLVYGLVSLLLIQQIDSNLISSSNQLISVLRQASDSAAQYGGHTTRISHGCRVGIQPTPAWYLVQ